LCGSVITFDPDRLRVRIDELDELIGQPGFWDDQEQAVRVSAERSRDARRLELFERLESEIADAGDLLALVDEDPGLQAEVAGSIDRLARELDTLEEGALFSGEYDAGPAVIGISAGAGGTDAMDWVEMLLRMYLRWAERRDFTVKLIEASPGDEAGLKSVALTIEGENAYGIMGAEKGVHRLVRLSPFDSAHRRHTAFARVDVTPWIADDVAVEIDEGDLRIDTYRASGAGGQHVNKTDSAVRITHLPTGIVVQCQNERSQSSNRQTAMRVLRSRLMELELQRREEELARERGTATDNAFGSQIRSYVLHPYTMVNDHRTNRKDGDVQGVLDGDLDPFIRAFLLQRAAESGEPVT
jgi:peptide chain release factor 2